MPFAPSSPRWGTRPSTLLLAGALLSLLGTRDARAEPDPISGEIRRAADPRQRVLRLFDTAFFPLRALVDLTITTTGTAQTLIEDQQVVPRTKNLLFSRRGEVGVFPTAFFETGFNANVGVRMVASVDRFASTMRVGFGGVDRNVAESRLRYVLSGEAPVVLTTEGLYERRLLGFAGFGPKPLTDARNPFRREQPLRSALFIETRQRLIASAGRRVAKNVEVIVSSSLQVRSIADYEAGGVAAISKVFDRDRLPGGSGVTSRTYGELTVRVDTRENRGTPVPGQLLEGYAGVSQGVRLTADDHATLGIRVASYLPIARPTNILSPRLAVDSLVPYSGAPVSMREARGATEYRGIDGRVDKIALIGSVDYRWAIARFVAARVFVDATTVAPSLAKIDLRTVQVAYGAGLDLHTSSTEVGRLAVSTSHGGMRLLFSYGLPPAGFGDRQHR